MIIIIDKRSSIDVGIHFRRRQGGPEDLLIDQYLWRCIAGIAGGRMVILREPLIQGCYPDLVMVHLPSASASASASAHEPAQLKAIDYQILRLIHHYGSVTAPELGSDCRSTLRSARRLAAAGLINLQGQVMAAAVIPHPARVVVVEAKVHNHRRALQQALLSTPWSSESWILSPSLPPDPIVTQAQKWGIGIATPTADQIAPRVNFDGIYLRDWLTDVARRYVQPSKPTRMAQDARSASAGTSPRRLLAESSAAPRALRQESRC